MSWVMQSPQCPSCSRSNTRHAMLEWLTRGHTGNSSFLDPVATDWHCSSLSSPSPCASCSLKDLPGVISKVTISDHCQENEMPVLCCRHLVIYKEDKVLSISYLFGPFCHVMPKPMQCQVCSVPMPPKLYMLKVLTCPLMLFSIFLETSLLQFPWNGNTLSIPSLSTKA